MAVLYQQILRGVGHLRHTGQGQAECHLTDVPPCWRYDLHVGGHSVHESPDLDVRFHQQRYTRHDGKQRHPTIPAPAFSPNLQFRLETRMMWNETDDSPKKLKQYTYFALTALNRPVPSSVKRTLTSLQIAQFLFGASYAAAHLFIRYDIPLNTPYQVATVVREALSTASSAASSLSAAVATPSSVAWGPLVKKLLLRAAGEEGVAERVPTPFADHRGGTAAAAAPKFEEKLQQFNERTHYETRWRREWSRVNCIDTSGEAFAIYLNLLYLAPLTFLFGRFFVKAYLQRGKPRTVAGVRDSGRQARVETTEAVERQGKKVEGELVEGVREAEVKAREIREQLREDVRKVRERGFDGMNMAGEKAVKEAMEAGEKGLKGMEKAVEKVAKEGSKGLEKAVEKARGMVVEQEGEAGVASEAEAAGEGEAEVLEVSRQQDVEAKDDGEKPSASSRMVQPSGPESESVERQDEILEGTEELREEEQREESTVGADVGQENKETEAPGLLGHAAQSETADTPDDDGDEEEEEEEEGGEDEDAGISATAQEDSDAMGQSGSLIDLVKEQASKAADEAAAEKKKRKKNKKKAKGRESEAS